MLSGCWVIATKLIPKKIILEFLSTVKLEIVRFFWVIARKLIPKK